MAEEISNGRGVPLAAGDAFAALIERAVEVAVKKALNVSEITNRRLMTIEESATYLALSVREIFNMTAAGELPPVKRGRRTMIDIQDLDRWIVRNKG